MTNFTATGSIQFDTIASSGVYDITALGAQGGSGALGTYQGGLGAMVSGDVYLAAGSVLEIIVGGIGSPGYSGGAGGGGGSFVVETYNGSSAVQTILAVAGGGGGAGGNIIGGNARTSTAGGNASGAGGGRGGPGGGGGLGGSGPGGGGGGGGFFVGGYSGSSGFGGGGFVGGGVGGGGFGGGGFGGGGGGGNGPGFVGGGGGGGGFGGGGGGGYGGYGGSGGGGGGGGSYLNSSLTNTSAQSGVNSGNGDVTITSVLCFCLGTSLATPSGHSAVETLRAGDMVLTANGPKPVRWVGRRAYDGRFLTGNHLALPVTIRAGALGEKVPTRDLAVSPGHGIWLDGALVPAWRLVNGVSVTQAEVVESVDYFNIELEDHALLFAHGAKVESFLDDGVFRNQFHNVSEYWQLYPDAPLCRDVMPLPRLESGFGLFETIARVNQRAGITPTITAPGPLRGFVDIVGADGWIYGWAQDLAMPEAPVALRLYAQGRYLARTLANIYRPDLRAAGIGSGCHGFAARIPVGFAGAVEVRREGSETVLPWTDALRSSAA